ncbi:hypothetical protein RJZ56_006903 [Blastomyces dermatitidis]|uniref:Uncharacterized protein n=2 Tax=Ajellomyces dermatitidis TaxID=5039 RepID=F2TEB4_AJEDA|nr:uncharacterized protein BDCG_04222 [Blastomyces dermatitidis ER-3]EEQ89102.1 hypothetical protein BDCG_04222 [Blastomyces dermatitidis ER-3]EGE81577.1 hypothetical protein BDDG_04520 [Blastomyces dermatitidis ATCC 18188]EQL31740.1 hypothetical protein BDFG_05969 [Blastomyces dermatitidis ATCC 26199]
MDHELPGCSRRKEGLVLAASFALKVAVSSDGVTTQLYSACKIPLFPARTRELCGKYENTNVVLVPSSSTHTRLAGFERDSGKELYKFDGKDSQLLVAVVR